MPATLWEVTHEAEKVIITVHSREYINDTAQTYDFIPKVRGKSLRHGTQPSETLTLSCNKMQKIKLELIPQNKVKVESVYATYKQGGLSVQ
jgi:hypothetical protein